VTAILVNPSFSARRLCGALSMDAAMVPDFNAA